MIARVGTKKPLGKQPSRTGFVYKPSKIEDVRKRAERKGGTFDSMFKRTFDLYAPAEGQNCIRILPPTWDGHDHFGFTIFAHQYIGPDSQSYLCRRKMLGKPCPACDQYEEAKRDRDEELSKQLAPKERLVYWLLNRMARDDSALSPLLYHVSWLQDKDIVGLQHQAKQAKVLPIDHPDVGYDLSFFRTGKGQHTRYSQWAFDREPSAIAEDQATQDEILQFIMDNPLPTTLNFYSAEHMAKALAGAVEEDPVEEQVVDENMVDGGTADEDEEPFKQDTVTTRSGRMARTQRGGSVAEEVTEEEAVEEYDPETGELVESEEAEAEEYADGEEYAESEEAEAEEEPEAEEVEEEVIEAPPARTRPRLAPAAAKPAARAPAPVAKRPIAAAAPKPVARALAAAPARPATRPAAPPARPLARRPTQ